MRDDRLDPKIFKKAPRWPGVPELRRVFCPVCRDTMYEAGARIHITNTAKHEVFRAKLAELYKDKIPGAPHFDFWLKYTARLRGRRAWLA